MKTETEEYIYIYRKQIWDDNTCNEKSNREREIMTDGTQEK